MVGIILAIIKAVPAIESLFAQVVAIYIASQNAETQSQIINAASLTASANTDEDRYKAADAWNKALSRKKYV